MSLKPIFLIVIILICTRCPMDHFYSILIRNNSSDTICPYFAEIEGNPQYPDTALPSARPSLVKIAPHRVFSYYSREPWEENIDNLVADTLSIFILDAKVYQDSSWSVIRENYLILKRYDLSAYDLESLDWKLTYP
jgi:hypothetical protein